MRGAVWRPFHFRLIMVRGFSAPLSRSHRAAQGRFVDKGRRLDNSQLIRSSIRPDTGSPAARKVWSDYYRSLARRPAESAGRQAGPQHGRLRGCMIAIDWGWEEHRGHHRQTGGSQRKGPRAGAAEGRWLRSHHCAKCLCSRRTERPEAGHGGRLTSRRYAVNDIRNMKKASAALDTIFLCS
jgi:hypothetical protein